MALKITTSEGYIIEGDTAEVIAALRALQDATRQRPAPTLFEPPPQPIAAEVSEAAEEDGVRNPRGLGRKLVLQALDSAGTNGLLQARAQQWIARNKKVELAVSSVRNALNQLQEKGWAVREGDIWKITLAGMGGLADIEKNESLHGIGI